MAILSRRNLGSVEVLRVNSNPNGVVSSTVKSLAKHINGNVYECQGGTSWILLQTFSNVKPSASSVIIGDGSGPQGAQGPQGSQGSQGPQGSQGAQGHQGFQGPQGSKGAQGALGAQGFNGSQGPQGSQGLQGPQGAQAAKGAQGPQGSQGSQGSQGASGANGTQGIQGNSGTQGSQGSQGSQGVQGSQGNQGTQGSQGSSAAAGSSLVLIASDNKASNGQYVDFSGLDGDTQKIYIIKQRIVKPVTTSYTYYFYPNQSSSGLSVINHYAYWTNSPNTGNTGVNSVSSNSTGAYASSGGIDIWNVTMYVFAERPNRMAITELSRYGVSSSTTVYEMNQPFIRWSNTTDNLTSIRLASNNASGFGAGTETFLYRLEV